MDKKTTEKKSDKSNAYKTTVGVQNTERKIEAMVFEGRRNVKLDEGSLT